jgi:hypothetical protein
VKVAALIVVGFMARLKVAVTGVAGQTPVEPVTGISDTTAGGTQGLAPVVKLHTKLVASATP